MPRSTGREGGSPCYAAEQGVAAVGEERTIEKVKTVKRIAGTDAGSWGVIDSPVRGRRRS